jgi:uncharacterized protein YkwD
MKKAFLNKIVIGAIMATTMTTLTPLGVSAATTNSTANNYCNLSSNGSLKTGWINDNGNWYYLDNTGTMQTGVIKINGRTYCLNPSGAMQTGKVKVNNKTYNCSSNGQVVATNVPKVDKVFDSNNNVVKDNNQKSTVSNSNSSQGTTNTGNTTSTSTGSTINTGNTTTSTDATTVDVQGLPQLPKTYSINVQASAENQILQLMNGKRVEAGLQPLTLDNTLVQVARYKSDSMIQYNYFDHTNPDGTKYTDLLQTLGYTYTTAGENIAYNTSDAVELFTQWWNSPGHRANMMNASYTKVGIGVLQGNGKFMGTQDFSN